LKDIPEELVESNFGGSSGRIGQVFDRVKGTLGLEGIGETPVPYEGSGGFKDAADSLEDQSYEDVVYEVGNKVSHNVFGVGVVVEVQGGVITVAFDDHKVGVKKLAASVAPLKRM